MTSTAPETTTRATLERLARIRDDLYSEIEHRSSMWSDATPETTPEREDVERRIDDLWAAFREARAEALNHSREEIIEAAQIEARLEREATSR